MHVLIQSGDVDASAAGHPIASAVAPLASARAGLTLALLMLVGATQAAQVVINGPVGSGSFGRTVTILPNGNIVVTDPDFSAPGPVFGAGAVYLYRPDGTLISTLRGASGGDAVGSGGVSVLTNGNYVVSSPSWSNGAIPDVGAVTFASSTGGVSGVVSAANSLVGSTQSDGVGRVTALTNGNYVVISTVWNNGLIIDAGAVTFGSGVGGVTGVVSAANSLVGNDLLAGGQFRVILLANGNYLVANPRWRNGSVLDAGALTFGSGTSGVTGVVSAANSLVGSTERDQVGGGDVTTLPNGSYVVSSPVWDNGATVDAGAVTFGSGTHGISGAITSANSLVGSTAGDLLGGRAAPLFDRSAVTVLTSGNYVVSSPRWDHGEIVDAGAVTFSSGTSGITGLVSPSNSLVGSAASDLLDSSVTALHNGNYVVSSPRWDNGAITDAGAVTFGVGTSGIAGTISPANSLVGSSADDRVGGIELGSGLSSGVTALSNGNYVVSSPAWNSVAAINAGAVTFASGTSGIIGAISLANSLIGKPGDGVGSRGVTALTNGNYVVSSPFWRSDAVRTVGAVTFGSGATGITGMVSPSNSLVGSGFNDRVGLGGVTALTNGNYVVRTPEWGDFLTVGSRLGAVTFGSGTSGIVGVVSAANSLVGSTPDDVVGEYGVTALADGNYLVHSGLWDNDDVINAGAVSFGPGTSGVSGIVTSANSLVGTDPNDFLGMSGAVALPNGNYLVASEFWNNGAIADAGAITLGLSNGSVVGPITSEHSVLGTVAGQGSTHTFSYDATRNQLAVGQPASNRVVLHRTGIATAISIVSGAPDPSNGGEPVTFTATITAAPNGPTDGKVTFTASSGETCVDITPTATSATTVDWSCTLTFTANGVSTVIAEYTGSIIHAYSGSAPEPHTTIVEPPLYADGFEGP